MTTIDTYLDQHENKNLLRFITCGSVDDGKSTLIGRLLVDSKLIYEDQLSSLQDASVKNGTAGAGEIDYALLMDGLKAEREQGITIDVAYRYFSTPQRKFIIADTPGHEQYTRNMATGASTANLAVILIDARYGVVTQTRRHAFIASLLGIRHLLVAVNKMDIGGYSEETYHAIRRDFSGFARSLAIPDIRFVPISALKGTNVVHRSPGLTPWYAGPALLELLETVDISQDLNTRDFRFPVQVVIRPHLNFRGFAGTVASGVIKAGERVRVLPSNKTSRVKRIVTADGDLAEAAAPLAVTLELADEVDVSSGDMIVRDGNLPRVTDRFEAVVIWMSETPLKAGAHYLVRQGGRFVKARVESLLYAIDVNSMEQSPAAELPLNGIGRVVIETTQPLYVDAYAQNHATGSLVFVDAVSNATAGAAMIAELPAAVERPAVLCDTVAPLRSAMMSKYGALNEAFEGFQAGAVTPEALKAVAAPFGIYQQRNGNFMLRVRVNGGEVSGGHLAGIAGILDAAGGYAHLTSRQDLQLHDIPAAQVMGAVAASDRLGLPFKGGGGNTYRNILVGSDSGLSEESAFDVYPYAHALNAAMQGCAKAFALPRKLKIGLFASGSDRLRAAVQDLGFVAVRRGGQEGFTVYAAGGLGRESSVGLELCGFLPASQVARAALALTELFYDHGDRANRQQARLRFLLKRLGAEAFQRLYLEYFARAEAPAVPVAAADALAERAQNLKRGRAEKPLGGFEVWERIAVLPTRFGEAVKSVRLFVPYGNLDAGQLRQIAALAAEYGSPDFRLLASQDILIPLVHASALPGLHQRLRQELAGIDLTFASYKGHLVTCVGASVCKIGLADSPAVGDVIAAELDRHLPPDTPERLALLRRVADGLRISGCPNACAGHPAAAIGIECLRRREGEALKTAGALFTGAGLGAKGEPRLSERMPGGPLPLEALAQKVLEAARGA